MTRTRTKHRFKAFTMIEGILVALMVVTIVATGVGALFKMAKKQRGQAEFERLKGVVYGYREKAQRDGVYYALQYTGVVPNVVLQVAGPYPDATLVPPAGAWQTVAAFPFARKAGFFKVTGTRYIAPNGWPVKQDAVITAGVYDANEIFYEMKDLTRIREPFTNTDAGIGTRQFNDAKLPVDASGGPPYTGSVYSAGVPPWSMPASGACSTLAMDAECDTRLVRPPGTLQNLGNGVCGLPTAPNATSVGVIPRTVDACTTYLAPGTAWTQVRAGNTCCLQIEAEKLRLVDFCDLSNPFRPGAPTCP